MVEAERVWEDEEDFGEEEWNFEVEVVVGSAVVVGPASDVVEVTGTYPVRVPIV